MGSSSGQLFEKFLRGALRLAVGYALFCAVSSVFLAGCGWLRLSPPPWTGAVPGLSCALLFDRSAWRGVHTRQLAIWGVAPRWQFWAVITVYGLMVGACAYFMAKNFSIDPLCHYGITNGILFYGLPVRDLAAPDRFLSYHALGNVLAAMFASALQLAGWKNCIEASLDVVSVLSLALFLGICSVFFALIRPAFPHGRLPGPLWLCFLYPLLVFGAGLSFLAQFMPDVLASADGYADFAAASFHPLSQYLGRRSAVPGFTAFVTFLCLLLLMGENRHVPRRGAFCSLGACFICLAYSSLEMFLTAVVLLFAGLFRAVLRRQALLGLAALVVVVPFIILQGGFLTAALFNPALPDTRNFFSWGLRAPAFVGLFGEARLSGIPLGDAFSWKVLAVEVPLFLFSLPLAAWLLKNEETSSSRSLVLSLIALSLLMVAAPFFVFSVFSPWDVHRLFFWPTLFAAILVPFVFQSFVNCIPARIALASGVLVLSCASAVARNFLCSPDFNEGLGRAAVEFPERLGLDPQLNQTWIASVGSQDLLFINGRRVLAPPFGTAGPVFYRFSPLLLDSFVQSQLAAPDTGGANMGLLTGDDLDFLRKKRRGSIEVLRELDIVNNGRPMRLFVVRLGPDATKK